MYRDVRAQGRKRSNGDMGAFLYDAGGGEATLSKAEQWCPFNESSIYRRSICIGQGAIKQGLGRAGQ